MNKENYQRIKKIFHSICELPPEERAEYLDKECKNDQDLRAAVQELLDSYDSNYLETPILDKAAEVIADRASQFEQDIEHRQVKEGTIIGHYLLVELIGSGGMGSVYRAERIDGELKQKVAIKLIKRGMDTDAVVRRFLDERRVLSVLNHPGIARLLDGGTTDDGRPYFIMEYIEGQPILKYADEQQLSINARLALFKQVCAAVHYAHQHLVIHRDIKPSNILVTNDGASKLLDFGIAKILDPEIAGHSIKSTSPEARIMTPEYASPEQIKGETITTASDVYSLGVLLYELLSGHQPYRFNHRTRLEIERVVCQEQVQKPSGAVNRSESYLPDRGKPEICLTPELVGQARRSSPEKLRRRLAGDLDTIVLKAMHKDPQRRYTSADQFITDIDRHFRGLPVIARNDAITYRMSKFISRHRYGVLAISIIFILSLVSFALIVRQRAAAERQRAAQDLLYAKSVLTFQNTIKDVPGSTAARKEAIEKTLVTLDNLTLESRGDDNLQRGLAAAYQQAGDAQGNPYENNFGDREGANNSYEKALKIREDLAARDPSNVEDRRGLAIINLRICQVNFGMGQRQRALDTCQKGINIAGELYENNQLDLETSRALPNGFRTLGYALSRNGNPQAALDNARKGIALFENLVRAFPDDSQAKHDLLTLNSSMADAMVELRDYPGALKVFENVLLGDQERASKEPMNLGFSMAVASDHMKIGDTHLLAGDSNAAGASFRKMLKITEPAAVDQTNTRAQNMTAIGRVRLGKALVNLGQVYEGLEYLQKAAEFFKSFAEKNPSSPYAQIQMAYTDMQVAVVLAKMDKPTQALEIGNEAREIAEKLVENDPTSVEFRGIKAGMYMMLGDSYVALATSKKQADKQSEYRKEAKNWYQQSYDILKTLKDEGQSTDREYGTPDELLEKIKQCDEM